MAYAKKLIDETIAAQPAETKTGEWKGYVERDENQPLLYNMGSIMQTIISGIALHVASSYGRLGSGAFIAAGVYCYISANKYSVRAEAEADMAREKGTKPENKALTFLKCLNPLSFIGPARKSKLPAPN